MLIDSHCHLDFAIFDHDRDAILDRCTTLGIKQIIVPGVTARDWAKLLRLADAHQALWPALGLHPVFMSHHQPSDLVLLQTLIKQHSPIAVGEIGLDFYLPEHNKSEQTELFEQQLSLAKQAHLPVILHVRKAHDETLKILKRFKLKGGIVHAFTGSAQQAEQYLDLGFLLGVGSVISYPNAVRLRQLFSALPLTSLALETDAPDMPLHDKRSERNTPESIATVVKLLSQVRPEDDEEIAKTTSHNVQRLFQIN